MTDHHNPQSSREQKSGCIQKQYEQFDVELSQKSNIDRESEKKHLKTITQREGESNSILTAPNPSSKIRRAQKDPIQKIEIPVQNINSQTYKLKQLCNKMPQQDLLSNHGSLLRSSQGNGYYSNQYDVYHSVIQPEMIRSNSTIPKSEIEGPMGLPGNSKLKRNIISSLKSCEIFQTFQIASQSHFGTAENGLRYELPDDLERLLDFDQILNIQLRANMVMIQGDKAQSGIRQ